MLIRLPHRISVFIDTNIFLYHLLDLRPSCTDLFRRLKHRELRGFTSVVVLSEVLHKLMLAEIGERHSVTFSGALRMLQRHPDLIPTLTKAPLLVQQIATWGIRILPLRRREILAATEISREHHLLTTDALIVATMRAHHLIHLASNDTDFTRVHGLTLWRP